MTPSTSINPDYIFLYNGRGADPYCVGKAETSLKEYLGAEEAGRLITVDSSYIVRDLNKFIVDRTVIDPSRPGRAVIFTGGNACMTQYAFQEEGMRVLYDAISSHGCTFIGFCSGAYLAGEFTYHYDKGRFLKKNYGLNLIDREHIGPAYPLGADAADLGVRTARAAEVTFGSSSKTCHVFWNGGGAYEVADPSHFVQFASFEQPSFQRYGNVAGLYTQKGRGNVVSTSLHPEIQLDLDEVETWCPTISEEERKRLVQDLPLQKELLAEVCNLGNLKNQNPHYWAHYYS